MRSPRRALADVERDVEACRLCPRLVEYRERVAREKRRAYRDETYWGRAVPGFGDGAARVLVVGLAPAAHGANRTGRMFTGDGGSGGGHGASEFLMRSLHGTGFANRPSSHHRGDGLRLDDLYLTAICRCAPPGNRPAREEIERCSPYLHRELEGLGGLRVIVALGKMAFDRTLRVLDERGVEMPRPRPRFAHGVEVRWGADDPVLIGSYHPSRQNTQTGRLTPAMLDEVFAAAARLAGGDRRV